VLTRSRARLRASALLVLMASVLGGLTLVSPATPAEAASWRSQVVTEAAKYRGDPYRYGAAGPTRFDCSGYTMYVYKRFGKSLPHNAASQYASMTHVAKNQKVPGDLLFFRNSSGRISHVAIYAGPSHQASTRNQPMMWHSPHSGDVVKVVPIYSGSYVVGRL
jgi:cell wall-associated NlpC family hydrolase